MGSLKPGATYIYEHADGVTYAREFGSTERTPIGWAYDASGILNKIQDEQLWKRIFEEAKTNTALQQSLERVILLYKLSISKYD